MVDSEDSSVFDRHESKTIGLINVVYLTPMEIAICELLLAGKTVKDIATIQNKSVKTVQAHKYRIYQKCKVHNICELISKFYGKAVIQITNRQPEEALVRLDNIEKRVDEILYLVKQRIYQ